MLQTSPIIITSLKLKPTTNNKNEVLLHAINIEARKESGSYNVLFGAPSPIVDVRGVSTTYDVLHWINYAVQKYTERNRVNTTIEKGEVERIQKLLV